MSSSHSQSPSSKRSSQKTSNADTKPVAISELENEAPKPAAAKNDSVSSDDKAPKPKAVPAAGKNDSVSSDDEAPELYMDIFKNGLGFGQMSHGEASASSKEKAPKPAAGKNDSVSSDDEMEKESYVQSPVIDRIRSEIACLSRSYEQLAMALVDERKILELGVAVKYSTINLRNALSELRFNFNEIDPGVIKFGPEGMRKAYLQRQFYWRNLLVDQNRPWSRHPVDNVATAGVGVPHPLKTVLEVNGAKPVLEGNMFKILTYNVWFREDVEMNKRMEAIGDLVVLHSPDFICFQEITPSIYGIFEKSTWWNLYNCSVSSEVAKSRDYFCMLLSKLPVKVFYTKPFSNTLMQRELCIAEVEDVGGKLLVVATSHLESPNLGPPKWYQMFTKERVEQATEALNLLKRHSNVVFGGDMNWDDKKDGQYPLEDGWLDAWSVLRPNEKGWMYDKRSNGMLTGKVKKRLDRFVYRLCDFEIHSIDLIGRDRIRDVTYQKMKEVDGEKIQLELPVLPSDHYGLLLKLTFK